MTNTWPPLRRHTADMYAEYRDEVDRYNRKQEILLDRHMRVIQRQERLAENFIRKNRQEIEHLKGEIRDIEQRSINLREYDLYKERIKTEELYNYLQQKEQEERRGHRLSSVDSSTCFPDTTTPTIRTHVPSNYHEYQPPSLKNTNSRYMTSGVSKALPLRAMRRKYLRPLLAESNDLHLAFRKRLDDLKTEYLPDLNNAQSENHDVFIEVEGSLDVPDANRQIQSGMMKRRPVYGSLDSLLEPPEQYSKNEKRDDLSQPLSTREPVVYINTNNRFEDIAINDSRSQIHNSGQVEILKSIDEDSVLATNTQTEVTENETTDKCNVSSKDRLMKTLDKLNAQTECAGTDENSAELRQQEVQENAIVKKENFNNYNQILPKIDLNIQLETETISRNHNQHEVTKGHNSKQRQRKKSYRKEVKRQEHLRKQSLSLVNNWKNIDQLDSSNCH